MAAAAILKNIKLTISLPWICQFWWNLATKFKHFKNPIWRNVAILKIEKNRDIQKPFDQLCLNLVLGCTLALRTIRGKHSRFKNLRWHTATILKMKIVIYPFNEKNTEIGNKTANIIKKQQFIHNVNGDGSKIAKIIKRWYYSVSHCHLCGGGLGNITFYDFAVFDPSSLTYGKTV